MRVEHPVVIPIQRLIDDGNRFWQIRALSGSKWCSPISLTTRRMHSFRYWMSMISEWAIEKNWVTDGAV